jgi:hypothetical protein
MRFATVFPVIVSAVTILSCFGAESSYAEARTTLEKWVETRQLISKARADWQGTKETLQQTVALFERELQGVQEQSSKLSTNNTQIDKERREAEGTKAAAEESLDRARQFASNFEAQIRLLLPQLPSPLQDTLRPVVLRMPADANTKMTAAERLRVLVGILNEVDKFNSSVSVFNEKRRNNKGEETAVETLYVGLGAAYFANETGEFAGTGNPGAKGWEWQIQNGLGPSIRETIRIYRNEQPAHFVSLPATIR